MKAYKGFAKDMTCHGFQYEEGKTYETEKAVCCKAGFHACMDPLDCFTYYSPNESEYHEVECDGKIAKSSDDSKIACTKIKIGGKVSIASIVKATIEYRKEKVKSATGYCGVSSATRDYGVSSATGECGASSAENPTAVAVAWGRHSKAKGVIGAHLVFADWSGDENDIDNPKVWTLNGAKMVQVNGKTIKADTWYTMRNGKIIKAEDD